MKKDAKIINVARGGIINESDLADALNNGVIGGAGIDVFSSEPLPNSNPLKEAKNTLLTPHLGASTYEAKEGVSLSICQQAIDFINHSKLNNAINVPISDMSMLKKIQPYLDLSELMGSIQSQLIDEPVVKIEINCYGSINELKPFLGFDLNEIKLEKETNSINLENEVLIVDSLYH